MASTRFSDRMQRKRQFHRSLGKLAPQFSLALDGAKSADDEFYLRLPFRRSWIVILLSGVFLLAFSIPLITVGSPLAASSDDGLFSLISTLFTLFWMLGWSTGVGILALIFLTISCGRETLRVRDDKLVLRIGMLGLGFGASYDASLIRNFRRGIPQKLNDSKDGNWWRGEHLLFDYANEPITFGSAIEEERAAQILSQLASFFPQQANAAPDLTNLPPVPAAKSESPENRILSSTEAGSHTAAGLENNLGSLSTIALIIANLVPLAGVLFDDWNIGEIMLLFWAESAVIGFYNLLKMKRVGGWTVLFYGPFFVGHYGAFMAGHLLFIYGFFSINLGDNGDISRAAVLADFVRLSPALLAFLISHGVSYFVNFLGRHEYQGKDISVQMGEPYKRIIMMHVTIILGGFLVLVFNTGIPALMLLIMLKLIADIRAHRREHRGKTVTTG